MQQPQGYFQRNYRAAPAVKTVNELTNKYDASLEPLIRCISKAKPFQLLINKSEDFVNAVAADKTATIGQASSKNSCFSSFDPDRMGPLSSYQILSGDLIDSCCKELGFDPLICSVKPNEEEWLQEMKLRCRDYQGLRNRQNHAWARSLCREGWHYMKQARWKEAREKVEKALEIHAKCSVAHYYRGCIALISQQPIVAERDFEKACALDPTFEAPRVALARLISSNSKKKQPSPLIHKSSSPATRLSSPRTEQQTQEAGERHSDQSFERRENSKSPKSRLLRKRSVSFEYSDGEHFTRTAQEDEEVAGGGEERSKFPRRAYYEERGRTEYVNKPRYNRYNGPPKSHRGGYGYSGGGGTGGGGGYGGSGGGGGWRNNRRQEEHWRSPPYRKQQSQWD